MLDDKDLAAIIAHWIFEAGSHGMQSEATRIQFMFGQNPERPGGGFGKGPLADCIELALNKHRSY